MSEPHESASAKYVWALFLGSLSLLPLSMILGRFDNATELSPTHPQVEEACFALAGLFALLGGGAGVYWTSKLTLRQRIVLPLVFVVEAGIGVFLVADHVASIVEGRLDFPKGKAQTHVELIQIRRAYQTHGKGGSQYLQTMPIWSNLEITPQDYVFMRDHRRPGDSGRDPDEVSSGGYFCAKVSVERYENAVRVLHAGSQKLPAGAVMVCPALSVSTPQASIDTLPKPTDYVGDFAHVLSTRGIAEIDRVCSELDHSQADTQIAVVTIQTLNGSDPAKFATSLGNVWGVGRKNTNHGVLLLLAIDDHTWRIAVGRGLAGVLPDSKASELGNKMTPLLRAKNFDGAVKLEVQEIAHAVTHS